MLAITGELFAVALLVLSIVPPVLTTDSATMEIKMDTLCQHDTPVGLKFTGIMGTNLVLPLSPFKLCEHPRQERNSHFPQFVMLLTKFQSPSFQLSRQGQFVLLKLLKHGLTGSYSLLASLASL